MARESELGRRPWAIGAGALGVFMLAVYVALIATQGEDSLIDVLPWALLMASAAIGAFASSQIEDRRMAHKIMIGTAVLFALLGVASGFSIGVGFLLAAGLSSVAAHRLSNTDQIAD